MTRKKTKPRRVERPKGTLDADLIKALSHPLRARALAILNERVASPKQIAGELGVPIGKLSYHVRTLWEYGFAELVRTKPRRGATEHFYRGTARSFLDDESWAQFTPEQRDGFSTANLKMIDDATKAAVAARTLDSRIDRHLSCTPLTLDEKGWGEVVELLAGTLDGALAIQANSLSRQAMEESTTMRATVSILGFESPSGKIDSEGGPGDTAG